jgi:hypothetical protein
LRQRRLSVPNGDPRNWFRLIDAIAGFHATYGHWPTKLRIYAPFVDDLDGHVFDPVAFRELNRKLEIIRDPEAFNAEDDDGNLFRYAKDEMPESADREAAEQWLAIRPRYIDDY